MTTCAPAPKTAARPPSAGRPLFTPLVLGLATLAALIMVFYRWQSDAHVNQRSDREVELQFELRDVGAMVEAGQAREAWDRANQLVADADELTEGARVPEWAYASLRGHARLVRGEAALALHRPDAAADFDAALDLFHDERDAALKPRALLGRGRAALAAGNLDRAREAFDEVLDKNEDYGAAYFYRAQVRERAGDEAGAKEDHDHARRLGLESGELAANPAPE